MLGGAASRTLVTVEPPPQEPAPGLGGHREFVQKSVEAARDVYKLWDAEDQLVARHPEAGHSFPDEVREEAYRWLDGHLK